MPLKHISFKKLFLSFSIVLSFLLILFQGWTMYINVSDLIIDKTDKSLFSELQQLSNMLEERLDAITKLGLQVQINSEIAGILSHDYSGDLYGAYRAQDELSDFLRNIVNSREDISEAVILTDKFDYLTTKAYGGAFDIRLLQDSEWAPYFSVSENGMFLPVVKNIVRPNSNNKLVMPYFRRLVDSSGQSMGILSINLTESTIKGLLNSINYSNQILYLENHQGDVLWPFDFDKTEIYQIIGSYEILSGPPREGDNRKIRIGTTDYRTFASEYNAHDIRIVLLRPVADISAGVGDSVFLLGMIGFLFLVLFVALFSAFIRAMFKPLDRLIDNMDIAASGKFDEISIDHEYRNEIGRLNRNFEQMITRMIALIEKTKENERKIADAEFKVLQSQINPHFIYNTLDSISWIAINRNEREISDIVTTFASLLRKSLKLNQDMCRVEEELEYLRSYVNLLLLRDDKRFAFRIQVEPKCLACYMPRFLLQPFVENSVIHAFEQPSENDEIIVSGTVQEDAVVFDVYDSGIGIDYVAMNECLASNIKMTEGYGVQNVNERIKLKFGSEYGVEYLYSQIGTFVRIKIPIIEKIEGDNRQ